MSRTDGVQLMVLCFTNFLYHLNTISGMKSRLERLERLHTSEFCLSRWQYLRKQIYFITNVLSRQKGKKSKIISWKIFCSIAFVMAIFSPIIIPMFWDTPVPKTHRAIKKILCFWLICFCDVRKKTCSSKQCFLLALADLERGMSTECLGIHRVRTELSKMKF